MHILIRQRIPFRLPELKKIAKDQSRQFLSLVRSWGRTVAVEQFTYLSDGLRVKGYLAYPKQRGRYPCIIYCRGGNRDFSKLTPRSAWFSIGRMASWGYIVIESQYRGVDGGEGREDYGGKDVNDVLNLIPCLREIPRADASRIGIYGWSRGGMMVYRVLRRTRKFRAAVIGAGQADFLYARKFRPSIVGLLNKEMIPAKGRKFLTELRRRSAVHWPQYLAPKTPILLLHGTSDWRVAPQDSLRMAEHLVRLRRPFRLVMFEGADHAINEYRPEVNAMVCAWFNRFVRDKAPLPNLKPHGE